MTLQARFRAALLVVAVGGCPFAQAEIGTQASLGFSDNITRTELDPETERLLTAVIGGTIDAPYGELERRARWEIGAIDYLDGDRDTESLAALDAAADFALVGRRLTWRIADNLGLQSLDPFAPAVPGSREYVNFFTTGPQLELPLSETAALTASLSLADVSYEEQPLDNSRTGASMGVSFSLGSRRTFGVVATTQDYRYDESAADRDFEQRQIYVEFRTERRRGSLRTAVGVSEIRDYAFPAEEPMVEIEWDRTVSDYGTIGITAQRGFSAQGDVFQFNDAVGGGIGVAQPIAGVSNPLKRSSLGTRFSVDKPRISTLVSYNVTRDEYEGVNGPLNRDISTLTVRASRRLTPRLRFELGAAYIEQDPLDVDVDDQDRRFSLGVGWRVGPRSELNFTLVRNDRSSTIVGSSYEENRAFLSFAYGARISGIQMNL